MFRRTVGRTGSPRRSPTGAKKKKNKDFLRQLRGVLKKKESQLSLSRISLTDAGLYLFQSDGGEYKFYV